ncbi:MAG: antitoxin [Cyanobacteria bacterium]|nr:antitoxin [Cyanobacteriota bacterium]
MVKRLQVVLDARELSEIQRFARQQRLTTAEWVRQALRAARKVAPPGDARKKLTAIKAATHYSFPAPDIDQMLREIQQGYREDVNE